MPTLFDMFICKFLNLGNCPELIPDDVAEDTIALTMQYSHLLNAKQNCLINVFLKVPNAEPFRHGSERIKDRCGDAPALNHH